MIVEIVEIFEKSDFYPTDDQISLIYCWSPKVELSAILLKELLPKIASEYSNLSIYSLRVERQDVWKNKLFIGEPPAFLLFEGRELKHRYLRGWPELQQKLKK